MTSSVVWVVMLLDISAQQSQPGGAHMLAQNHTMWYDFVKATHLSMRPTPDWQDRRGRVTDCAQLMSVQEFEISTLFCV